MADRDELQKIIMTFGLTEREQEIHNLEFTTFENELLVSLDLGLMGLDELPPGIFDELTNLKMLNLSGNNFRSLPEAIFSKLQNLTAIGLNNCKLESLSDSLLDNQSKLEIISIGNNHLKIKPIWVEPLRSRGVKISDQNNMYNTE